MHFMNKREDAQVQKSDGTIKGPYKAKFAGDTIFIDDPMADVEEGDCILRQLPNGNTERSFVTNATFHDGGVGGMGPHFQIKFSKTKLSEQSVQNISINNAQGIQVGSNNIQNITNTFDALIKQIESADASPEDKKEAKFLLREFLAHPLVVAITGGVMSGL